MKNRADVTECCVCTLLAGKWLLGDWIRWCLKIITSISNCAHKFLSLFLSIKPSLSLAAITAGESRPPSNLFYFRAEPHCISLCSGVSLWNMGTSWYNRRPLCWDITKRRLVVSYRRFAKLVTSVFKCHDCLPVEGGTDRLARNIDNYQSELRNISEERRSHLRRCGSLKSNTDHPVLCRPDPLPKRAWFHVLLALHRGYSKH